MAYAESFRNDTGRGVTNKGKNLCPSREMSEHIRTVEGDTFLPRLEEGKEIASITSCAKVRDIGEYQPFTQDQRTVVQFSKIISR